MAEGLIDTDPSLALLDYIAKTVEIRRQAIAHDFPVGSVLGQPFNVLTLPEELFISEVNETLAAIGGIKAVIESDGIGQPVTLVRWLGADDERPDHHVWIGSQGKQHGQVVTTLEALRYDLQKER